MKRIETLVIGAGQAGLAMSRCLSDRSVAHVVIERGEVAEAWRSQRWNSLRLLTPNWQSRLPGFAYSGPDPDGFMEAKAVARFLGRYAELSAAPVVTGTTVLSVAAEPGGYRVATTRGGWLCRNLVLASGACSLPIVPGFADAVPREVLQLTPFDYRGPSDLPEGGVLVVGASATGVQLAAEIVATGHDTILAVGEHIRVPRHYRGRDIQWWMDRTGILDATTRQVDDLARARGVPSLQLVGEWSRRFMDLNRLQDTGVEVVGRLAGIWDGEALFSGSLANKCALSDLKMNRLLDGIDTWADWHRDGCGPAERFEPTRVPVAPRLQLDLGRGRVRTILWATGFRPNFSWLRLPVFDRKGGLVHREGVVAPGLYVLGLPFLRRRKSALLDGVGGDAEALADHILAAGGRRAA